MEGYIIYNCILDWERSLGKEKEGLALTINIRYRDTDLIEYRTVCELRRNVTTSPGGIDVNTVKHEWLGRKPPKG